MNRYFIITIDTEGDNLWAVSDIHQRITTENAKYLFRFQELCEKYHFIPTYLTNYEMAQDRAMIELGLEGLKNHTLEIGSHEHAWNSPPYFPLIKRPIKRGKPYLGEYPKCIIRKKLEYLTKTLEDTFQCEIKSHRGGRWCLNDNIIDELCSLQYEVDCTCTPGISWESNPGWSLGSRGTNWKKYNNHPFVLKPKHDSNGLGYNLIEVPVTSISKAEGNPSWFRPNGNNLPELLGLIDYIFKDSSVDYIEFMLHSSELMPGGSPTFKLKGQIDSLYKDLDTVFNELVKDNYVGIGLTDYSRIIRKKG